MGTTVSYLKSLTVPATIVRAEMEAVNSMIASDKVVIFSKTYCPYCTMAKEVFNRLKQKFTLYELDQRSDGPEIQNTLGDITGAKSVPRVFVNGKFVGGGTDVQRMEKDGSLLALLA
ncbi:glutaredoxin 1 [Arctopsyche grandis]|uniref:glutaredoxin 1 n=1 Tax=Arctopsyche grandis TaxID=121162 RepID=UPI00406DA3C2